MGEKTRKRIATFCRALAARLDPPPAMTISTGPFGVVPVDYRSSAAHAHVRFTHGGSQ